MWSGFITGFAEKTVSLVEERDKEIRAGINRRIEDMYKQAAVAKKESEARRDELLDLADQLMSVGFSEAEARLLIDNPSQAESIINYVKATPDRVATPSVKQKLFAPVQSKIKGYEGGKIIDAITERTAPTKSGVPLVLPTETTTAMGLPSRAEDYVKRLNIPESDLATELPARKPAAPLGLDMSVFREANTFSERKNAAQVALLDAEPGSDEYKQASQELSRIYAIEDSSRKDKDKEGITESNVRANLRNLRDTIRESMAGPGNTKRVFNPETNTVELVYSKSIKPKDIERIENSAKTAVTSYLEEFYKINGNIPDVVRRAAAPFLVSPGTPVRVGGGQESGRGKGAPTPTPASGMFTVTTPDGRVYKFPTKEAADGFKKAAGIKD